MLACRVFSGSLFVLVLVLLLCYVSVEQEESAYFSDSLLGNLTVLVKTYMPKNTTQTPR